MLLNGVGHKLLQYILLSNALSQNEIEPIDIKWLIPTIMAFGIFAIEVWTRIYKPYIDGKKSKRSNEISQRKKEIEGLERLTKKFEMCVSNLENSSELKRTQIRDQIIMTVLDYPSIFSKRIDNFNNFLRILENLYMGCEYFAETVVTKNVLVHMAEIDRAPNDKVKSPWEIDSRIDNSLSHLLGAVLKDAIVSGKMIDKPLFDQLNPLFWEQIAKISYAERFNQFMNGLNMDMDWQKDYGILKAQNELRLQIIRIAKELIESIKGEIDEKKNEINELERQ